MWTIAAAKKKDQAKAQSFSSFTVNNCKHQQNLSRHNSETRCHLKMKLCTDVNFCETICLKIMWELDKTPLKHELYEYYCEKVFKGVTYPYTI